MPILESKSLATTNRAVLLTALPVEYQAMRAHLSAVREELHPEGTVYEYGTFSHDSRVWEVLLVEASPGNTRASLETERALQHFKPQVALFVGVAGGLKDVSMGDVVFAQKVYGYESGKVRDTFEPRPDVGEGSYALEQRARAEARKGDWVRRIKGTAPASPPRTLAGAIAAGEKVVAETRSQVYQFLRAQYGDALAVEMEGRGFLAATRANRLVEALVIRGISDLLDGKEAADFSGSQDIAARHASAFAFEVLAHYHPISAAHPGSGVPSLDERQSPPLHGGAGPKSTASEDAARIAESLEEELRQAQAAYRALKKRDRRGPELEEAKRLVVECQRKARQGRQAQRGDILSGRYELQESLGTGGFSTVWKAFDEETERHVAIKILHQKLTMDASLCQRFFRGAEEMARLEHPHVVRVLDRQRKDGPYLYYVMEYAEGGDLKKAVLEHRLSQEQFFAAIWSIGAALGEAHRRGIIHRDVKPANVLLRTDGSACLSDFDLVRVVDDTGGTSTGFMGSIPYASPEARAAGNRVDARSDLYSLGMTVVFGLHGAELPFEEVNLDGGFIQQLKLGDALETVLLRATAWKKTDRYDDVTEFLHALKEALVSVPPLRPQSSPATGQTDIPPGAKPATSQDSVPQEPDAETNSPEESSPRPDLAQAAPAFLLTLFALATGFVLLWLSFEWGPPLIAKFLVPYRVYQLNHETNPEELATLARFFERNPTPDALPRLAEIASRDTSPYSSTRGSAIEAIRKLGTDEAKTILVSQLASYLKSRKKSGPDSIVIDEYLEAASQIGPIPPSVLEAVLSAKGSEYLTPLVISLAGESSDVSLLKPLKAYCDLAADNEESGRTEACRKAFVSLKSRSAPTTLASLTEDNLRYGDPMESVLALYRLRMGERIWQDQESMVVAALSCRDPWVRMEAIEAAGKLGGSRLTEALRLALLKPQPAYVDDLTLEELSKRGGLDCSVLTAKAKLYAALPVGFKHLKPASSIAMWSMLGRCTGTIKSLETAADSLESYSNLYDQVQQMRDFIDQIKQFERKPPVTPDVQTAYSDYIIYVAPSSHEDPSQFPFRELDLAERALYSLGRALTKCFDREEGSGFTMVVSTTGTTFTIYDPKKRKSCIEPALSRAQFPAAKKIRSLDVYLTPLIND